MSPTTSLAILPSVQVRRFIPIALAVLLLALPLGAWWWIRSYRIAHTPVLIPLRPLEPPDLTAPVIPLPFADISATLIHAAHSTSMRGDNGRFSELELIDGTSIGIDSAVGKGPSAAPYVFQEEYRDQFLSSEKLTDFYYSLAAGKFSAPWRFRALPDDAKRVRRITPFVAQAGAGFVVESDPDTARAYLWDKPKTRLAALTSSHGGASHLWEIIESWYWQDRPEFPLEPAPEQRHETVTQNP